jgi:hypothetical protein
MLLKRIRTWFVNAPKRPGQDEGAPAGSEERAVSKTGHFNFRTVCAKLHPEELRDILEVQTATEDGDMDDLPVPEQRLARYQRALTTLCATRTPEERTECEETAHLWNTSHSPPKVQQKSVE